MQKIFQLKMKNNNKNGAMILFLGGFILGVIITVVSAAVLYKSLQVFQNHPISIFASWERFKKHASSFWPKRFTQVVEDFLTPIDALNGKKFGKHGQLTFELYRGGTFIIDGKSHYAWQRSDSYRDAAFIRSTKALPKIYKVNMIVGDIDYSLEKILGLPQDPEYPEGPQNENGCYLLVITDEAPVGHHTNIWWHQHRKVVIDIDNNIWGHGMPNPIFMVYLDKDNKLMSYAGKKNEWQDEWKKAIEYDPHSWYKIEIEKTKDKYILTIYNDREKLLKRSEVPLKNIWHEDEYHPDYLIIGDPHENYYQGSMKIKSISLPVSFK